MNAYTGRLSGHLCLTLFLAFALGPFTGRKMVEKTEHVIFLEGVALTPEALRPACPNTIFDLKETYTVAGRGGVLVPRKLQTKMVIKTSGGSTDLPEPGLKRTKRELIAILRETAPDRLQVDLDTIDQNW